MNYNVLALAYIGDAIYEIYIRNYLLINYSQKVNDLQKAAISYVSAKGQEKYIKKMIEEKILTEEEIQIFKRGRNHSGTKHPKNTDIVTYKYATGLETLIGYLYMNKQISRIDEIMSFIIGEKVCLYMEKMS